MLQTLSDWLKGRQVDQEKSEAIIAVLTLLYQADGRVRMAEQTLFEELLANLPWNHPWQSKADFHRDRISKSLEALSANDLPNYLSKFVPALKADPAILSLLRDLAISDGELDEREAQILQTVTRLMVNPDDVGSLPG